MNLIENTKSFIKTVRFLKLFKKKSKQSELVKIAIAEKGILYKIIQNTNPELITNEEVEFNSISKKEIINLIEKNLKIKFSEHFKNISEAKSCASIGQVHKAKLLNGSEVAIKIQYPKVHESIMNQIQLLRVAAVGIKLTKISKWNLDTNDHLNKIASRLNEELDYTHELQNLELYAQKNPSSHIVAYHQYSSQKILTQNWIEGVSLRLANEKFNEQQKKTIAQNLVNEYLKQIFTQGFCQGDNNFSNVLINPITLEVYWIDFGNWIVIDSELRKSLFTLIYKTIYKQDLNYLGHFENIGFDLNKLVHFQNLIPNLLQVLFDPFLLNSPYNLHNWRMEERINQLLGENKWWFRSSGNSNFLELMKSFFGLIKVIEYLNIKLNWQELFLNNADSFKLSSLENGLNNYINTIPKNKELAKSLVIQIIKDNKEHVKVELPATTFFELENLISDDIKLKLQIRKIDIMKIKEDYLEKGLRAGQVFTLDDQNSNFKIFLI